MENLREDIYKDFTLLIDGNNSFKEIIKCINEATKSIKINMFIWRDDHIGNEVARAILEAANRGVKVDICVDRYGVVLEKSEEAKKSFFHKEQSLIEKIKIKTLEIVYPMDGAPLKANDEYSDLYNEIMNHPNISVNKDEFRADHSKYYVFDENILIMGGVNIEDKENGKDMQGRVYQDYMVKLTGKSYVDAFYKKIKEGINMDENYFFGINLKLKDKSIFEMENLYLDMIRKTKRKLHITMAYFSKAGEFINEIINAYNRGVEVTIVIPDNANYQSDSNKKAIKEIMKRTNDDISVYFSKKMLHTKLMINDEFISLGSTNITKKAFNQLNELNLFVRNIDSEFRRELLESVEENISLSNKVASHKDVKYNKGKAFLEGFLV